MKLSILQVPVNWISVSFLIASRKKAEKMFTQCWIPLGEVQSWRHAVSGGSVSVTDQHVGQVPLEPLRAKFFLFTLT